jgi:nucleotide-binding universal stress UspA family protein
MPMASEAADLTMRPVMAAGLETTAFAATPVFDRVVCGIDLSREGRIAARRAAQVVAPGGSLLLVTATVGEPLTVVAPGGLGYANAHAKIDAETRERFCDALMRAREDAREYCGDTRTLRVEGQPLNSMREAIERERATLAVVGSHQTMRLPGIVLGSVATHLLHQAPCSVLVARRGWREGKPRRVLVGIDGSLPAAAAFRAARELADRLDRPVEQLTDTYPVRALVEAAGPEDLIVVGSRGLRGPRALGSVSERVAHRAPCSVLVVRPTHWEVPE